jgi:hypothetical protein
MPVIVAFSGAGGWPWEADSRTKSLGIGDIPNYAVCRRIHAVAERAAL